MHPPGFEGSALTSSEQRVLQKYLALYAEPEAHYAEQLSESFGAAVVVPLCAEKAELLDGLLPALVAEQAPADSRALLIAVVNAREDAPPEVLEANAALLQTWRARSFGGRTLHVPPSRLGAARPGAARSVAARPVAKAELLELPAAAGCLVHVLLVDASSPGQRFPPKQGVGLARRIGCDIAAALAHSGQLASRYIGSADGDVRLPAGYVAALARPTPATALLFPFEHEEAGDVSALHATELVELSWRYYLLGLAFAGSPFAYHSLGSCLAVDVAAYAQVRGYPKLEAAEDFHLLSKLSKLGEIETLASPLVRLAARRSLRVPFGTGPAVERALSGRDCSADADGAWDAFRLHDPRVFLALRCVLAALEQLALGRPPPEPSESGLPPRTVEAVAAQIDSWSRLLPARLASCPTPAHRRHRIFESFDALATLQAIHGFRDGGLPPIPWRRALAAAPFLHVPEGHSPHQALVAARQREACLPARRGLESPRR